MILAPNIQPTQAGDNILVHFLHEPPLGTKFLRKRNEWPLHITLVPWFRAPKAPVLREELRSFASRHYARTVTLGHIEQFSVDTKVTVLASQPEARQLHMALLALVATVGGELRAPQWVGDKYKAHMTHHEGQTVPPTGSALDIAAISLVQLRDTTTCEVVDHFQLARG